MFKLVSSTLFILLIHLTCYADLGHSIVYQIQIELKNNIIVKGYFEDSGYHVPYLDDNGLNKDCTDKGMANAVRLVVKSGKYYQDQLVDSSRTFILYKNIHYPQHFHSPTASGIQFGIVKQSDVINIDTLDILTIKFISAKTNRRDWLQSELLIASDDIVDMVNSQKYFKSHYLPLIVNGEDAMQGVILFSYDSAIDKEKLKKIISKYHDKIFDFNINYKIYRTIYTTKISEKEYEYDQIGFRKLKLKKEQESREIYEQLNKKNVVLIRVWSTC